MAHNKSLFLEALDRAEGRRDGGYKNNWSFSVCDDSEKDRTHDLSSSVVSMEDSDRQQPPSPEEKKTTPVRHFAASDPLRTYENRPNNNHLRSLHRLAPKKHIDSPIPNRTNNYFIFNPAPSQGIVIQGRNFQHVQLPSAARKPVQRSGFVTTQPPVEVESIVLTCPEVSEEDNLTIKRRVPQKRRPLEDCSTFPSPLKPTQLQLQTVYQTICLKCNKPREIGRCSSCGTGPATVPCPQTSVSTPTPRPSITLTQNPPRPGPSQGPLQSSSFYRPRSSVTLPVRESRNNTGQQNEVKRMDHSELNSELNDPIVLSSDDEDEADNASTGSSNRLDSVSPRPADSAHSSPAPSGGKVEAAVKNAAEQDDDYTDFFEDVNMTITIPRRTKMKDQFGNYPAEPQAPRPKKPKLPLAKCSSIILECRSIRIGTLRRVLKKPVVFTTGHIQLDTEGAERQLESIVFRASELISCEWCNVRKLPVLFFQTTEEECDRLRTQLKMTRDAGGDWFHCSSQHMDEKYIVLIFENGLPMEQQVILEDILGEIGWTNNLNEFPSKLTFEEANLRLVNYSKALEQKDDKEKDGKTPLKVGQLSPVSSVAGTRTRMATRQKPNSFFESDDEDMADLQPTFSGPIVKLMVYPPPPAKGGILVTNEDLHCLNDGEFLNDVIIDFYLKYLVLEKLKKEEAQRIHIFSSFFYKRLNQRERRNAPDTTNLPIHKRKHNRVKTWTRHVDLFQKDFIFVPINESAHWYLAVICFPGLEGLVLEPNPLFQEQSPDPVNPESEELIPDHCRPLSPAQSEDDPETDTGAEEGCSQAPNDGEQLFTSELHRISVCYGNRDVDAYTFSDDQSSGQDECSEDGGLADDSLSNESSSLVSKPTLCKQPCILIMDSLRGPARSTVVKTLREYLEVEWEVRRGCQRSFGKDVMKGSSPRVPQQDNFSDCGVYVLQFVESFFENPIPSFHLPLNLSQWFPQLRMKTKRQEIKDIILNLQNQQGPDQLRSPTPQPLESAPNSSEPEIQETASSETHPPLSP